MRIMIACERSGVVRDAFLAVGHDAVSCDVVPSETDGPHLIGNVIDHLSDGWDMMIAFPPCTYLCRSGARWWPTRRTQQAEAAALFLVLALCDIPALAIENPIGIMSRWFRKPDQIVQPWMFGHGETKATCLWLKGLPPLVPTDIVAGRSPRCHYEKPGHDRGIRRSRTLPGIAAAMAQQWGK